MNVAKVTDTFTYSEDGFTLKTATQEESLTGHLAESAVRQGKAVWVENPAPPSPPTQPSQPTLAAEPIAEDAVKPKKATRKKPDAEPTPLTPDLDHESAD